MAQACAECRGTAVEGVVACSTCGTTGDPVVAVDTSFPEGYVAPVHDVVADFEDVEIADGEPPLVLGGDVVEDDVPPPSEEDVPAEDEDEVEPEPDVVADGE
jgi:hypothetical protein